MFISVRRIVNIYLYKTNKNLGRLMKALLEKMEKKEKL
jgi:hypothetical protein